MSTSPDGVATKMKYVLMDEGSVETMQRIGGGNLSLGVREAARRLQALGRLEKSPYVDKPMRKGPPRKKVDKGEAKPKHMPTKGFLGGWL